MHATGSPPRPLRLLLAGMVLCGVVAAGPLAPDRLRVEYMNEPRGVDVEYPPRFTWALAHTDRNQAQTAFEVEIVRTDVVPPATVFASGVTASNASQNVAFPAFHPTAGAAYSWVVRYTDRVGAVSAWSANATFSAGLYNDSDWQGAAYIGQAQGQYRTKFATPAGKYLHRATAYIIGLGYYKLDVDGERVSRHELGAFTTYAVRVYYDTWDCTAAILEKMAAGSNEHAVGVTLGNGWFAQRTVKVGTPRLRLLIALQFTDNSVQHVVSSVSGWHYAAGPVMDVDIYDGEVYDARRETPGWTTGGYDDSQWATVPASVAPAKYVTSHAVLPVIRGAEDYTPCNLWVSSPGVYVFDFCQNMAGITTLRIPAGIATQAGLNISMLHAEAIYGPPPSAVHHHYSNAKETNVYITKGDGASVEYRTQFTYAGFRYVQLTGYPGTPTFDTLTAHFIHTNYELTGDISFSDPELDAVQHITRTAAMSNFQSIPTDCPQRERRGWLGDAQLSAETNMHNFDMGAPYTSFMQQIADSQDASGSVQDCVPWYGHGRDPADPAWGGAFALISDWVGKYYHDNQIFKQQYTHIRAHLEQLISTAASDKRGGLLAYGGWSDWCPPEGCAACWGAEPTNSVLVSSFYYLKELDTMARYAAILGKPDDEARYTQLYTNVSAAFNVQFYDAANKTYVEKGRACKEHLSQQTTISLAYELGLIPKADEKEVIDTLVADVAAHGYHLDVGIVGIKYLLPTLSRAGRGDVALMIAQARTPPSYIYMVQQGATTLWETWTGSMYAPVASWNHIMFGSNSDWYFKHLAGITMSAGTRGWQQLRLQPEVWNDFRGVSICANLSSVSASISTPRGEVSAAWKCPVQTGTCGKVQEKSSLTLSCTSGTIKAVTFASFGTPAGDCASGFSVHNCSAKDSVAVVEKLCLGKSSCSVPATNEQFGGDPCLDVPKALAVQVSGCDAGSQLFDYTVTVPVGTTAQVVLPTMGHTASVSVAEGSSPVWRSGAFVPGVPGVVGARVEGSAVVVDVTSGQFAFAVSA